MIFPDITINRTINGYIISQHKPGHDWTNQWVAESVNNLVARIRNICEQGEKEEQKEKMEKA